MMAWPTFSGRRGESAAEYHEGLEAVYILSVSATAADTGLTNKELILKVQFRQGLQGDAYQWYRLETSQRWGRHVASRHHTGPDEYLPRTG